MAVLPYSGHKGIKKVGRRSPKRKRVDVWKTILVFKIGDRVRHKRGVFERGVITNIEHIPICRDGFFRLDETAFEAWVKIEDGGGESSFNVNELEYDPLYQLAKEAEDAA